jgi:hypothetical protein
MIGLPVVQSKTAKISNGTFAGWQDIGGSSTAYTAVGAGDFFGNGTDDILFRDNTTGDVGFYALSNGAFRRLA